MSINSEKPQYPSDWIDEEDGTLLFKARYVDSVYGLRLILLRDGRRRGLWVNLEEEIEKRKTIDRKLFQRGLEEILPKLHKLAKKEALNEAEVESLLRTHFAFFFECRTEGKATRLSWRQVRALSAALKKGDADEKNKDEDED